MFDFGEKKETKLQDKEDKKEEEFPIDINYEKVRDWLLNRNFISKDWFSNLKKVQEELIKKALINLPKNNEEINKMNLTLELMDYFTSKIVLSALEKTEEKGTSFLGFGGNPILKEWGYIIQQYENKNLYIAESASFLTKQVNFEMYIIF
jgi:hypothetical protein